VKCKKKRVKWKRELVKRGERELREMEWERKGGATSQLERVRVQLMTK
jgi:hypothetical protein